MENHLPKPEKTYGRSVDLKMHSGKSGGRRPGDRNVDRAEILQMENLYRQGVSANEIARRLGRSPRTVYKFLSGKSSPGLDATGKSRLLDTPPPLLYDQLSQEAKDLLEDFRAFRLKYFNRVTPPFQLEMADTITDCDEEEVLIFVPPGYGKSLMVSHDYPIWRMLRARVRGQRFACLLLSESKDMGVRFIGQIKATLESNRALQNDYGYFKPEHPDNWRRTEVNVDGFPRSEQKEATFESAGARSQINGLRLDLVIADDLVGEQSSRNVDLQTEMEEWFHTQVESRLDPGGTLAVIGTRWRTYDLYGRLLRLKDDDEKAFYRVIRFSAHDISKCPGVEGPHETYPNGCMLWAERVDELTAAKRGKVARRGEYERLMRERHKMGETRFEFVYNQLDVPDEGSIVRPEWIEACKDPERRLGDIPPGTRLIATLDPAPVAFSSAQVWAYDPEDEKRYLVKHKRAKLTSPEVLKLMEEWWTEITAAGHYLIWVVEKNSAHFILQSEEFKRMRMRTGMRIVEHTTQRNKNDPLYGVEALGPLYQYEKVSLPWADIHSREAVQPLISELIAWPNGASDDCVMAQWFFEWNIRRVKNDGHQPYNDTPNMPPYLVAKRKLVTV